MINFIKYSSIKMRYTLRSSNSSNLQGPLKFKRDKPLLETIEEVEEEYVSNNNLKLIIMLQLVCFCIVCYYIKENPIKDFIRYICYYIKENPIKDFIHYFYNYVCLFKFNQFYSPRIHSYLGKVYMIILKPLDQVHNYLCLYPF
jgi:hypothetical protein